MSREVKVGNEWVRVAGRGKAEYGASHYQSGSGTISARIAAGNAATVSIAFATPMPDTDYIVVANSLTNAEVRYDIRDKTVNGFTLQGYNSSTSSAMTNTRYEWQAFKLYSDKEYDGLLDDVATLKSNQSFTRVLSTNDISLTANQWTETEASITIPRGKKAYVLSIFPYSLSVPTGTAWASSGIADTLDESLWKCALCSTTGVPAQGVIVNTQSSATTYKLYVRGQNTARIPGEYAGAYYSISDI